MIAPEARPRVSHAATLALTSCVVLTSGCEAERAARAAAPGPSTDYANADDVPTAPADPGAAPSPIDAHPPRIGLASSDVTPMAHPAGGETTIDWRFPQHDPGELPRWIEHQPRPAETIEQIAFRYDSTATSIRRANDLADDEQPRKRRPKPVKVYAQRHPPPREKLVHTVVEDDTWGSIARTYGVDTMDLRRQNWGNTGRKPDPGESMDIWIDPLVYRSILDDAPTSQRLATIRPGAHGRGAPQDGMLVAGVQVPPGEGYELRYPNSAWGTTYAVRALVEALDRYHDAAQPPYPLRIGTMSRQRGREVGGHHSHQTGRDVDIRLPLRAEVPQALSVRFRRVDWDLLWALIKSFDETGAVNVVFLDYKAQKRLHAAAKRDGYSDGQLERFMQWPRGWGSSEGLIRHEPGHDDHIHVRFACGPAEPECVED